MEEFNSEEEVKRAEEQGRYLTSTERYAIFRRLRRLARLGDVQKARGMRVVADHGDDEFDEEQILSSSSNSPVPDTAAAAYTRSFNRDQPNRVIVNVDPSMPGYWYGRKRR